MAEAIYSRELQELKEVGGREWEKARGARSQSPGCCAAFLLSKCNKSNKVSLQPLAQAASKGTLLPRTNGVSILPARGAQEEPRAPRQGCPFFHWHYLPDPARTYRPPPVRAHRRGRPPGLRPGVGRPASKDGPRRRNSNSRARSWPPRLLPRTLWPGSPGFPR